MRFQDYIDVYCVDWNQNLIHLYFNPDTNWTHRSEVIRNCPNKVLAMCGVRTVG